MTITPDAWQAETEGLRETLRLRNAALDRVVAERDEWRQTALDERGAVVDLMEQIKGRDAVVNDLSKRIMAVLDICDEPADDEDMDATSAHCNAGYELALQDIRRALDGTDTPTVRE